VSAEGDRTGRGDSAQASVEFVALLPLLGALLVIAAQTVVVGWALWSAGNAARAGARAEHVGADAEAAARHALPSSLRGEAVIKDGDGVRVQVHVPALVPGIQLPSVAAASRLDESAG
jgi:hypothetical protein